MTIGHPTAETLAAFAVNPQEPSGREVGTHIGGCEQCRREVASIEAFCKQLAHREMWRAVDAPPGPSSPPPRVAHQFESLRFEDEIAEFLLEPVLNNPETLRATLLADTRYRSAGVVRRLIAASESARDESPLRALALADVGVVLAERLDPAHYEPVIFDSVRGAAWRERANVLRTLGRHAEALTAIEQAEEAFRRTPVAEIDLARVDYIRATVLRAMQRYDEALPYARAAGEVFRDFGETIREVHAGLLEGAILFDMHQPRMAVERFRPLLAAAEEIDDGATLGFLHNALGASLQESGDVAEAARHFQQAAALFEHLGMEVERLRTSWSLALVAVRRGDVQRGLTMLTEVACGFDRRGCAGDAALVLLDVAEQHVLAGRNTEVTALCRQLVDRFTAAGMLEGAVLALRYLQEAAAANRATAGTVRHVSQFIRRLEREPALLFAPPQD